VFLKLGNRYNIKVKLPLGVLNENHAMKTYSLTSTRDGVSGQLNAPAALPPGKEPLVTIG
jgi:hypothetical protein